MKSLISLYTLKLPVYFVYMLQQVEYEPAKFYEWFVKNLEKNISVRGVMHRQQLVYSLRAKLLVISSYVVALLLLSSNLLFLITSTSPVSFALGVASDIVFMPFIIFMYLWLVTTVAYYLIVVPQRNKLVHNAEAVFATHKGVKIAVLGSYGKTTMKELLATVLAQGKHVSATPGNMNVSVSHARFARTLKGDEEVVIVEFGEGAPGDVSRMAKMLKPDYAIITGLAPNHLDHYESLDAVAKDLLSVYESVDAQHVLATAESPLLNNYLEKDAVTFSRQQVLGWRISNVSVAVDTLSFTLSKGSRKLHLKSGLIGEHQVAPLALVSALACELGLTDDEVVKGVGLTMPYEHRMQPRFMHGAWLIDDTYNGNLEGVRAGLKYLASVSAKRKWYVTPGLVDQGKETERVHKALGESIAEARPDIVVLMENSVRPIIEEALRNGNFQGEVRIESDPLAFYTNIEHVVATGDIVLMQNDWTDNYH